MRKPIINGKISFDDTNGTMTQQFSDRMKIVVDFKNLAISTIEDDKVVDQFSFEKDYSLGAFNHYKLQIADSAKKIGGL